MDIEIRDYQDNDLDFVNEVLEEAFQVKKDKVVGDEFIEIVACVDNRAVGYLLLTKVINPIGKKIIYNVDYVCVLSKYRGHGIGKKLLEYAYYKVKELGGSTLQLTCSRFRVEAHKLYESCNFIKRDSDIYRKEIL